MAERRMFHRLAVESDKFLDLSVGAQALYFHLGMQADDDGFVNGPRLIARQLKRPYKDLQALIDAGFLLDFDGIVVLTHWRMANSLQNDRLNLPQNISVAKKIFLNEHKIYTKIRAKGCQSLWSFKRKLVRQYGIQSDSQRKGSERKRKERKGKEKKGNERSGEEAGGGDALAPDKNSVLKFMNGKLGKGVVLLSEEQMTDLLEKLGLDGFDYYVDRLSGYILKNHCKVRNHYETILKWWNEDRSVHV